MRTDDVEGRFLEIYEVLVRDDVRPMFVEGFDRYTGVDDALGSGNTSNSFLAGMQFLYALALSPHEFLDDLANAREVCELEEKRVLGGMRILDIGCGHHPTFARCSRALGAQVYTIDTFSERMMYFSHEKFTHEQREEEVRFHVKMHLDSSNVEGLVQRIGSFDYISSAYGPDIGESEAGHLLRIPGLYVGLLPGEYIFTKGFSSSR